MGGRIFSTGTEDIKVKIISLTARTSPRNTIGGRLTDQPVESAFNNGIYLFSPAPEHFIGFSRQHGRVVNLGKLPAGELIFGIKTPQNYRFQTGAASKNPDHVPHAIVKSFVSGTMEVWFEDEAGVRLPASDRDFNDAVIELSGGITRDSSVTDLLSLIHEQKGEAREKAIAELKKLDPKTALQAGLR
jgi:hypothetical protein